MKIKSYLDIFIRRKWAIILTVAGVMAVIVAGTRLQTPSYRSTTVLRIAASVGGQVTYSDYMYADRLMNTYVQIATSKPVLAELMARLDISQSPVVKAEVISNTELIKITAEDTDPKRAAMTANTLADILILQSTQLYTGGGKSSLEVLSEQLAQIQPNLAQARREYEKLIVQTPPAQEKIEAARQSLQLQQNTYATLLAQYNQAQYRQEIQSSMITVIEPAVVQQSPYKPQVFLNYSFGLLVGLAGGIGLVFLLESLDTTLYTTEDIEDVMELTALARIPKVKKQQISISNEGFSLLSDPFRYLAAAIQANNPQPNKKALLVMSAEPGQGKSVAVYYLAVALAEFGKKVVAVDCNIRLPALHTLFGLSNDAGLVDVLDQKASLREVLQESVFNGVKVLPSGQLPLSPPKLLGSPQMVNLIGELKRQFDYIVLDAPAILATADVTGVVPNVDSLLIVVRRGHAKREALQSVKRVLAGFRFRGKSINLVINQAEKSGNYDYYEYRQNMDVASGKNEPESINVANDLKV